MIDLKANNEAVSSHVVRSESSSLRGIPTPPSAPLQKEIRERAYELYESRGREPGQDEQDWLRAEREIALAGANPGRKSEAA
jgi:hypothetical protein